MGILIAVFVSLLVVYAAVFFGCLWLLPLAFKTALVALAAWLAWHWAGPIVRRRGGARAWWNTHRPRVQAAALIFGSMVLLAFILWSLWGRYAPQCAGGAGMGCWPSMTTSSSPVTGTGGGALVQRTLTAGSEWSEWVELPLGIDFVFDRAGHNLPYAVETKTTSGHPGVTATVPADLPGDKRTACERQVRLGEYVGAIRLRMVEPGVEGAKFNLAFFPLGNGPCS